jgi:hypothetical protein
LIGRPNGRAAAQTEQQQKRAAILASGDPGGRVHDVPNKLQAKKRDWTSQLRIDFGQLPGKNGYGLGKSR